MAACPYKRWRKYEDPYSGELRYIQYPCGHCANCLKNLQNSWRVRLTEMLYRNKGFVYDTLTIRNDMMDWIDVREYHDDINDNYSRRLYDHYDGFLPYFPKEYFNAWIKRGRELYFKHHKKRLNLRYFACLELGPKWSRPHIHCVFVGITHYDYVTYFAKPWREMFGFTKTYYVERDGKAVRNIAKYISKYISKGSFENAFVLNGVYPKPFRAISHGIGLEYISSTRLKGLFEDADFKEAASYSYDDKGSTYKPCQDSEVSLRCEQFARSYSFTDEQIKRLTLYYDENGFCYSMPRYYRDKFTQAYRHSYLSAAYSRSSYAFNCIRRNKEILELASNFGFRPRFKHPAEVFPAWIYTREGSMVWHLYFTNKEREAKVELERNKIELANHYKRSLLAKKGVFTYLTS